MSGKARRTAAPKKKTKGYKMPEPIPEGEILIDELAKKKWLIGPSIGVGGFGEIYSACEQSKSTNKIIRYPYVIKIEPHENGPLFVEKHFYIRNGAKDDIAKYIKSKKLSSLGMPLFYGSGSHQYQGQKYRYLVLERYGKDVWTLFKEAKRVFSEKTVFQLGLQMLDVLEYIHSRGYVHADIKGANILMGLKRGTENQAYLVDFGLATKVHDKEFKPDPKCAHNGTIEYTSRDAHLGVSTVRGDLEILGYNMLQWIVGELPWEKHLRQPKVVQAMKEAFMKNVREEILEQFNSVPDSLIDYFEYINSIEPKDSVDYMKCKKIFEKYFESEGISQSSKIEFTGYIKQKTNKPNKSSILTDSEEKTEQISKTTKKQNGSVKSVKQVIKADVVAEEDCKKEEPKQVTKTAPSKNKKRKSLEPSVVVKVKKTKIASKATPKAKRKATRKSTSKETVQATPQATPLLTPPTKENYTNTATQTSRVKTVTLVIPKRTNLKRRSNSLNDIHTLDIEENKVEPKKRLVSDEEAPVTRVLRKRGKTTKR